MTFKLIIVNEHNYLLREKRSSLQATNHFIWKLMPLIPCLSMPVMSSFSSSKHALSRCASCLDMPCCISCFSKAFRVLCTLLPRVRYIQSKLRTSRARCGSDFTTVAIIGTALIDDHPWIGREKPIPLPQSCCGCAFRFVCLFRLLRHDPICLFRRF